MKTLRISLNNLKGNLVEKANKLQELFGGDSERKPNFFGYFLRVGICPETRKVFISTNRFDSKKELQSSINDKLAII